MLPPRVPLTNEAAAAHRTAAAHNIPSHRKGSDDDDFEDIIKLHRSEITANDLRVSYLYELLPAENRVGEGYTFFLVHGAGQCAASYTLLGRALSREGFGVFCPDLRGHGYTWRTKADVEDLRIEVLIEDLRCFILEILDHYKLWSTEVFLVGHSMGGAVVAKTALKLTETTTPTPTTTSSNGGGGCGLGGVGSGGGVVKMYGVALLDVCEELATASLRASKDFAKRIPETFITEDAAIDWAARHTISNRNSARLSIPSQLTTSSNTPGSQAVRWKVPLAKTERFWIDWFKGMNQAFLSGPWANRILITSGIHAVDSELAIAQMKGKIQIEVLTKCGHIVHEDQSDAVAEILLCAIRRQEKLRQILNGLKNNKKS